MYHNYNAAHNTPLTSMLFCSVVDSVVARFRRVSSCWINHAWRRCQTIVQRFRLNQVADHWYRSSGAHRLWIFERIFNWERERGREILSIVFYCRKSTIRKDNTTGPFCWTFANRLRLEQQKRLEKRLQKKGNGPSLVVLFVLDCVCVYVFFPITEKRHMGNAMFRRTLRIVLRMCAPAAQRRAGTVFPAVKTRRDVARESATKMCPIVLWGAFRHCLCVDLFNEVYCGIGLTRSFLTANQFSVKFKLTSNSNCVWN